MSRIQWEGVLQHFGVCGVIQTATKQEYERTEMVAEVLEAVAKGIRDVRADNRIDAMKRDDLAETLRDIVRSGR